MYNLIKNSPTEVFQRNVRTAKIRTLYLDINYDTTKHNTKKNCSKNVKNGDKTDQYYLNNNANSCDNLSNHINNNHKQKTFKNQVLYSRPFFFLSFFLSFFGVVVFQLFLIDQFHACIFVWRACKS